MTTIEHAAEASIEDEAPKRRRGFVFWIVRYLPAEIAGTAAMIVAGLAVTFWTDHPAAIAVAALLGEFIGFYVVLAISVGLEQSRLGVSGRKLVAATFLLLVAEFGAAEILDTLLIRPAALLLGVTLLQDPVWGLLAGKLVADVIFYAVAAGAFTLTDKIGLRRRAAKEPAA
ncbi:hypothetical protein GCM10009775_06060 [Microbacterium aoyamense]|uniref:Uncharacterized protein n=1 Tax=Microbacterium aoyamense TaxID=344166 RepID=A0ABP5AKI8_9MICO|nr:hypothetical protein [Microbacterium aoyamense]